jgi:diguanylate cyclase (GGDEF)-like protein
MALTDGTDQPIDGFTTWSHVKVKDFREPEPVRTAADLLDIGYWSYSRQTGEFELSARGQSYFSLLAEERGTLAKIQSEAVQSDRFQALLDVPVGNEITGLLVRGWTEYSGSSRVVGTITPISGSLRPSESAPARVNDRVNLPLLVEAIESGPDSLLVLKAICSREGEVVDFEVVDCNSRGAQLLGTSRDQVSGRLIRHLVPPMVEDGTIKRYAEIMRTGQPVEDEIHVSPGGFKRLWIRQRIVPLREGVAIFAADVTDSRLADETADRARRMFERIAVTTPDALLLWDVDTRRILYHNRQLGILLRLASDVVHLDAVIARIDPEGAAKFRVHLEDLATSELNAVSELVVRGLEQDHPRHLLFRSSVFDRASNERPRMILTVLQDVSEQFEYRSELEARVRERDAARSELEQKNRQLVELNEQLSMMALTDATTGIKNRRAFQEKLDEEAERAQRYNNRLALVLIDIDRFKQYNDTHGHPAGDHALKGFAQVLVEVCRKSDTAARYGGEEFAIILPNTSSRDAGLLGDRIRAALANTVFGAQGLTASIGCAEFLPGPDAKERLVAAADEALYRSKNGGRDRVTVAGE